MSPSSSGSAETSVDFQRARLHYIAEDENLSSN
jgi:hypothetical protein